MKKIIACFLAVLIIVTLCLSLFACTQSSDNSADDKTESNTANTKAATPEERLKYNEKYGFKNENGNEYFIFKSDGTGEYHKSEVVWDKTEKTVYSGYVNFDWRSASDGAVHLFKNGETQLKDNNTAGYFELNPVKMLFVSEDFVTYYEYETTSYTNLYDNVEVYSYFTKKDYIRAGSTLYKND